MVHSMAVNGRAKDLTGQTFNHWKVLEMVDNLSSGARYYLCQCVCGKKSSIRGHSLTSGGSESCGCVSGKGVRHLMSKTRVYKTWTSMKHRCNNKDAVNYETYGGRGISVCERWNESFEEFYKDMGDRPKNTSIDRIDPNGNYEPSNCRWADKTTQDENKRKSVKVIIGDEERNITRLCRDYGVSRSTVQKRLALGMTFEEAIKKPSEKPKYMIVLNNGLPMNKDEFFREYKIPSTTINRWISKGKTLTQAVQKFLEKNKVNVSSLVIEKDLKIKLTSRSVK